MPTLMPSKIHFFGKLYEWPVRPVDDIMPAHSQAHVSLVLHQIYRPLGSSLRCWYVSMVFCCCCSPHTCQHPLTVSDVCVNLTLSVLTQGSKIPD